MTSLFGSIDSSHKKNLKRQLEKHSDEEQSLSSKSKFVKSEKVTIETAKYSESFSEIGLCEWAQESCRLMGFRRPFPIQSVCIPAILAGRDVLGCAETGSGKTAAFALPILQKLSEDQYGVFAVVLTPTRELAIQINEQFLALGASIGVRTALIIGGENIMNQGAALSRRPHIIIATPGRLRHHIESADPPYLSKTKFVVLDEADRLMTVGFESELEVILSSVSKSRQTLLFSATLNTTLLELESLAMKEALRFDLTTESKIPSNLLQEYIFIPARVKMCYLVAILKKILGLEDLESGGGNGHNKADQENLIKSKKSIKQLYKKSKRKSKITDDLTADIITSSSSMSMSTNSTSRSSLIIIFTATCKQCQETAEILRELQFDCVELHSMLPQNKRLLSLHKFKNQISRILVATDLAGRGLDIPAVDHVINYSIPKFASDYIHRIGRTARAGRMGRSLSLITPHDIELIHNIEEFTGIKMTKSEEIKDDDIRYLLNPVSKAMYSAELKLMESGFDEKTEIFLKRKRKQKRKQLRRRLTESSAEDGNT